MSPVGDIFGISRTVKMKLLFFFILICVKGSYSLDIIGDDKTYKGKLYRFSRNKETYNQASKICRQAGGFLALSKNAQTTYFLARNLGPGAANRAWIGLNDKEKETVFQWEDGTKLDFNNGFHGFMSQNEGPHKRWRPLRLVEDCVALDQASTWHDYICASPRHYFICEFKIPKTTRRPTSKRRTTTTTTTTPTPKPTTPPTTTTTPTKTAISTTTSTTTQPPTTTPPTPPTTIITTTTPTTTTATTATPQTTTKPDRTTTPRKTTTTTTPKTTTTTPKTTTTTPTTTTTTPKTTTTSPKTTTTTPTTTATTPKTTTTTPTTTTTTPTTTTTTPTTTLKTTTTAPKTTTTTTKTSTTTPPKTSTQMTATECPHFLCNLDCGLSPFEVNAKTGCFICQCEE